MKNIDAIEYFKKKYTDGKYSWLQGYPQRMRLLRQKKPKNRQ